MTDHRRDMAEELSDLLVESLPVANGVVLHFREQRVWDQAILESLATFVQEDVPLPADVRTAVTELLAVDGVGRPFLRRAASLLDRIPATG